MMVDGNQSTTASGALLRSSLTLALVLLAGSLGRPTLAQQAPPVARIGIVTDGPIARDTFLELFREEIRKAAGESFRVEFPADAMVDGGWSPAGMAASTDAVLARTDLDAVLALGVGVASQVCGRSEIERPVVVPFAFRGCPTTCPRLQTSRIRTIDLGEIVARDLRAFREIVPFEHLTILKDPTWPEDCRGLSVAEQVAPAGATVDFLTVDTSGTELTSTPARESDAVYIMPLLALDEPGFRRLVERLTSRGLPTFSMRGEVEVEQGVLASLNTEATMASFARGAALDIVDLLEGRSGEPVSAAQYGGQLTVNMATARTLGLSLGWELLTRARLVQDEESRRDRTIDLGAAIRRAIEANLDLAVRERRVAAGAENRRAARAAYLPQLDIALAGVAIDDSHANPTFGQYRRLAAGSLTLNQLIYSDAAAANRTIQRELQVARELDWQALRLDIARSAAVATVGVLRADALVRVRNQQVALTRTNLELARLRRSLGAAGASEVHRWEAELATARAGVLGALSIRRASERQLSKLLDEPLATRWDVPQIELAKALEVLGGAEAAALLETRDGYDRLIATLVPEGLERAPELAALEAAIAAQERATKAARRASYVPTVGLQADLNEIVARDASGGLDLGPFVDLLPTLDDTSWRVALQASVRVASGGLNKARTVEAEEELAALRLDYRNARERLAERTLVALDAAAASWPTISLRRQAAEAAARTRELVDDAYARGAASILDLLDAQNSALDAELAAMTSVYDFLDDWAEVQRAVAGAGGATGGLP